MALEIASIANANLRAIAEKVDESCKKDGQIKGDEYQIFAQTAMQ